MRQARVWIGPERPLQVARAVAEGGGHEMPLAEANVVIWTKSMPPASTEMRLHSGVEWVQLLPAGAEKWIERGLVDSDRVWTSGKGAYATLVAEHAVSFVLAAARRLPQAARRLKWEPFTVDELASKTVAFIGGGGIARAAIDRLAPFGVRIVALTRSGRHVPGAERTFTAEQLHPMLSETDFLILAAPLTAATRHLLGAPEFRRLRRSAWLINVGRGGLVDTLALVEALATGEIAGACLDVTEPEPLPSSHQLWSYENVLITPHCADRADSFMACFATRVRENVQRFTCGDRLVGVVSCELGY